MMNELWLKFQEMCCVDEPKNLGWDDFWFFLAEMLLFLMSAIMLAVLSPLV